MFEVIPAVDVSGGRLSVFSAGGPRVVDAFDGEPTKAIRAYASAGARWIHVVDVDHAMTGASLDTSIIESAHALGVKVEASGGVRDTRSVDRLLAAGAARVVLSSGALTDEEAVKGLVATHGARLLVGIEVEEGRIRSRGADPVDIELLETLGWLTAIGAAAFLVTAVSRVGELTGPDLSLVKRVVRTGRPVLAAGGIGTLDDLDAVRRAGAVGAVVGRAAMEGGLDLSVALSSSGSSGALTEPR